MSIVPSKTSYRETQITNMRPSDPGRIYIDAYPQALLCGYVQFIAPASGAEYALIPPDNTTGNYQDSASLYVARPLQRK
jgi:membrane fusion protein, multidrug efflux system